MVPKKCMYIEYVLENSWVLEGLSLVKKKIFYSIDNNR